MQVAVLSFGDFYDSQFIKLYTIFMAQLQVHLGHCFSLLSTSAFMAFRTWPSSLVSYQWEEVAHLILPISLPFFAFWAVWISCSWWHSFGHLQIILPPGTHIPEAYGSGSDEDQVIQDCFLYLHCLLPISVVCICHFLPIFSPWYLHSKAVDHMVGMFAVALMRVLCPCFKSVYPFIWSLKSSRRKSLTNLLYRVSEVPLNWIITICKQFWNRRFWNRFGTRVFMEPGFGFYCRNAVDMDGHLKVTVSLHTAVTLCSLPFPASFFAGFHTELGSFLYVLLQGQ